jgi:hypothetical protein
MARREQRRADRRKRKQRSAARGDSASKSPPTAGDGDGRTEPALSRSELKNREAREALEPLSEGERPLVVTIGAAISALLAVLSVMGYALWDVLRDDARPPLGGVVVFVAIFGAMAWGMWKARYWAVMGFQTVLVFALVLTALGLVQATTVLQVVGDVLLLAVASALFYFMIKAMARIQMPERRPRE